MLCFDGIRIASSSSSFAALQLNLLPCLAQQASLQRFPSIPTSFLLKGWPATSGDGARSGKPPLAAKKLLLEVYGLSCLWGTRNMGCVDTLSRTDKKVFWELDLVSTPLEAVSTHSTNPSTGFSGNWD
ncbi:hypothetical protein Taro_027094 [Colocasia esculenta]|uniref:Uncharacterized protein n=1 Tax=Colocasia esculenta TaxID=4460 RepID=A0A843VMN2_COLES|nr:hypothetical protein [Colocasia esculenta]